MPYTRDWFLGVANLRGGLFGVVDLASYVMGAAPAQRSDAGRAEARLVALLDNLGKGASGAAVQNLNIALGLEEGAGLS